MANGQNTSSHSELVNLVLDLLQCLGREPFHQTKLHPTPRTC